MQPPPAVLSSAYTKLLAELDEELGALDTAHLRRQLTTIDLDILNFSAVQGEAISRRLGLRISNQVGQQLIFSLPP